MQSSFFVPAGKMQGFMSNTGMNSQEGVYLYGIADPSVKKLLPPPLELTDPEHPLFYLYIVNIREPTFAPWYMEGGLGVVAKYGDAVGVYFFSLMLSGPGALMGAFTGREGSGLPKKLCERIVVERTDAVAHCFIERNGVRLVDVDLEIGQYNHPEYRMGMEDAGKTDGGFLAEGGGCLLHRYQIQNGVVEDMALSFYNSPTRYHSWEPATAAVKLASSVDDPWAEIPLVEVLGAAWSVCDNWIKGTSVLYRYPNADTQQVMQYLFTGRYDHSLICKKHQRYGY